MHVVVVRKPTKLLIQLLLIPLLRLLFPLILLLLPLIQLLLPLTLQRLRLLPLTPLNKLGIS